jgi:Terminase large subunit, T4likevirus-type, N-terminal
VVSIRIDDPAAFIASLTEAEKAELDKILEKELKSRWLPDARNEPQLQAYYSEADLLLFGGAAGGGKTDLLCGVALTEHTNSVIFRKQSTDLRGIEDRILELAGTRDGWNGQLKTFRWHGKLIELGYLAAPGSEESWRGRAHDFIGFDEGAQLSKNKVRFVLGWLRSVNPKQRRRAIIGSNPPTGGEGEWLIEWFAPWLDPKYPNPAIQGELRWAATAPDRDGATVWLPDGRPIVFLEGVAWRSATDEEIAQGDANPDVVKPQTRTFIQSLLRNNPYLANTGYRAQIQSLPEPLRSQLLNGDFVVGREDHEWQVIPTAWVKAAQERWKPQPPAGAQMTAIGVDVAQGGADRTVLAPRFGPWFSPLVERPGILTPTGSHVAALVVEVRRNNATIIVDMGGGYGGAAKQRLNDNDIEVMPYNGANSSNERSKDRQLPFANKRAEVHWRFREALDPDQDGGSPIALPPDPQVLGDLTAPRWKLTARGIQIEEKLELKKPERLGRSPDKGDAIVTAWSEGERALVIAVRKANRASVGALPKLPTSSGGGISDRGTGWMGKH